HHLTEPFPEGESWAQAVDRVGGFLRDLPSRWSGQRVLIIGHVATRWALEIVVGGSSLPELAAIDFDWQEGWEYRLEFSR
ncbi:MAG: histidine phosphatase family protein, partial [Chloroflexota bacterium]